MTTLANALAAPPATKKAPVDPNVKVLRGLARAGWGNPSCDGTVFVARDGGKVFVTNTYILRIYPADSVVGGAVASFAPAEWDGSSFTLRLRASGDNYGLTTDFFAPALDAKRVADLFATAGAERVSVSEWAGVEPDNPKAVRFVEGTYTDPFTGEVTSVRANAKYLGALTEGVEDPRIVAQVRKTGALAPLLVFDGETLVGAAMPVRL